VSRIGIALVGLGPGSEPHVKSLHDLADRVDVRWAVSRSASRPSPFPATTDLAAAIADPSVHAVMVITPPAAHLEVAAQAFAAGKHVLVEKPLELTSARGAELVAAGRAANRRLGVVLQHRFREGGVRLRKLLEEGRLGHIEAASMAVPWWRPQAYYDEPGRGTVARDGGGVLLTQAIHTLDMFRSLIGPCRVISAQARTTALHRMETEDFAAALLELESGAPATVMATTAAYPGRQERIEIVGSKGTAVLEGGSLQADFLDGTAEKYVSDARTGSGASMMDFDHGPHRDVLADFLDAIRDNRDPRVTGEEALATQRLIDAILASAGFENRP